MSHYYLDASALVKRYVDEVGSDWLRMTITPPKVWSWTTPISIPELANLLHPTTGNWAKSSGPRLSMSVSCDGG